MEPNTHYICSIYLRRNRKLSLLYGVQTQDYFHNSPWSHSCVFAGLIDWLISPFYSKVGYFWFIVIILDSGSSIILKLIVIKNNLWHEAKEGSDWRKLKLHWLPALIKELADHKVARNVLVTMSKHLLFYIYTRCLAGNIVNSICPIFRLQK